MLGIVEALAEDHLHIPAELKNRLGLLVSDVFFLFLLLFFLFLFFGGFLASITRKRCDKSHQSACHKNLWLIENDLTIYFVCLKPLHFTEGQSFMFKPKLTKLSPTLPVIQTV